MRGGAMRSILIIGTLTLVGIAGLWFLFGDSTEVFELLYSSPTTIRTVSYTHLTLPTNSLV